MPTEASAATPAPHGRAAATPAPHGRAAATPAPHGRDAATPAPLGRRGRPPGAERAGKGGGPARSGPTPEHPRPASATGRTPDGAPPAPGKSRTPLTLLLAHARPHRPLLLTGTLLSLLGSAAGLAMPMAAKYAVEAYGGGAAAQAKGPLLALLAVVVAGALLAALGRYLLARTGEAVVLRARRSLVTRLLRLKVAAVDRLTPGDLLSRATSDTTLLHTVLSRSVVEAASGALTLIGTIVLMAVVDAFLLSVTALVLLLSAAVLALLMPRIQRAQLQAQEAVGEMGSLLDRALQAFRTVKASGIEDREAAAIGGAARTAHDRGITVARWTSASEVAMFLATQLAFLAVLGVGGARVVSGAMEVSALVAFLLYVFGLLAPLSQLTEGWTGLNTGLAAVRRIDEIESLPGETHTYATKPERQPAPLGIEFKDVAFAYADTRAPAHHGITFTAPPGGLTALVGPSGAGKTTVFALLERFYDHDAGTLTVGGRDIRDWPLAELRAALAYVEQDAPVLAGTLRDNLLLAAPDASTVELAHALTRTRLTDLVDRLPEGLDTQVGHRGTTLSGGERQRIALARALLRKPAILLLDEVTSQLDAVNEERLREVILELAADTTVLVIAHRLSTVVRADRIVVMEAGRVRAVGTHAELVESDALYGELAATQFATERVLTKG
ncbi:putative ABC transporter ATP-binding protein [Streptomyces spiroverticillatus]|uniref:ABC transporter ATP-binding protein n=1 Tax=Streptomyces finlayi TaxID=67296 RepID=A0A918X2P0_9ACTN|nr:ABC transporter ATP-binding protein [Streptomyces finlayi]GHA24643.1 putative ABC transporter ATP-binding protein [Streptomyces spiroverticillatus]GHD05799.1 putative ABC transporter ATP-binding protein [Streptomyces finlayi]